MMLSDQRRALSWFFSSIVWFVLPRPVAAAIDWSTLISKTRELSVSGLLGLIETEILYTDPGTEQKEIWRIAQSVLGIGSLRVLSKICQAPCFEVLHQMYGIQPVESIMARVFWLNQPSWSEMSLANMTSEHTSYHRINQGVGPQAKILWTADDAESERLWWSQEQSLTRIQTFRSSNDADMATASPPAAEADPNSRPGVRAWSSSISSAPTLNGGAMAFHNTRLDSKGQAMASRPGVSIMEGTTDKWWMDRWQLEVLTVAATHQISIDAACQMLTYTYFGYPANLLHHMLTLCVCCLILAGTFTTAMLSNWSWIGQFVGLTCQGYFVTRTSSLRAWAFRPDPAFKDVVPRMLYEWPDHGEGEIIVRYATQTSGSANLRVLFAMDKASFVKARNAARGMRGRYRSLRDRPGRHIVPYTSTGTNSIETQNWLCYDVDSTYYGLAASVEPDNVTLRSLSVLAAMVNGLILLILGFGATVKTNWNPYILILYVAGVLVAVLSRSRSAEWTMPEFDVVDLSLLITPPSVTKRLDHLAKRLPEFSHIWPNRDGKASPMVAEPQGSPKEELAKDDSIV